MIQLVFLRYSKDENEEGEGGGRAGVIESGAEPQFSLDRTCFLADTNCSNT